MSRHNKHAKRGAQSATQPPVPTGGSGAGDAPPPPSPSPSPAPAGGGAPQASPVPSAPLIFAYVWQPREVSAPEPRGEGGPASGLERALALPLGRLSPLLDCFTTREARPLRTLSRAAEAHIAAHPWSDMSTAVRDLAKWRACFPRAVAVKLSHRVRWHPGAVMFLANLTGLDVSQITDIDFLDALIAGGVFERVEAAKLTGCPEGTLVALLADDTMPSALASAANEALFSASSLMLYQGDIITFVSGLNPGTPPRVIAARLNLLGSAGRPEAEKARRFVVEAGGIGRAISCLRAYKGHAGVAAAATKLLFYLSQAPAHAKAVAHEGPAPALLEVIEAHPADPLIVVPACGILSCLLPLMPTTAGVMIASGAPRILLNVIGAVGSDFMCPMAAASALAALLQSARERTGRAVAAVPGAVPTLFGALATHGSSPELAGLVMSCLSLLEDPAESDVVGAAMRAGAVQTVAAAAVPQKSNVDVLRPAVALLYCGVSPINKNPQGPHRIDVTPLIDAGAVDLALASIKAGFEVAPLACCVLQLLLVGAPDCAPRVLAGNPVIATVSASLPDAAISTLLPQLALLHTGLVQAQALTSCLLAQPSNLAPLASMLRRLRGQELDIALELLTGAAKVKPAPVADAAGAALVEALGAAVNAQDAPVVETVLSVLKDCALGKAAAVPALGAAGAPAAVLAAMAGATTPKVAALGGMLLHLLSEHGLAEAVAAAGGLATLLRLGQAHMGSQDARAPLLQATAALGIHAPGAFAPHIAATADVALGGLSKAAQCGDFLLGVYSVIFSMRMLKSGAPVEQLTAALRRLKPGVQAAVTAARRAGYQIDATMMQEVVREAGDDLAEFVAAYPEAAEEVAGWRALTAGRAALRGGK